MNEQEIFTAALDSPPGERDTFLDNACAGNALLRERLQRLLQLHADRGEFLAQPAAAVLDTGFVASTAAPGTLIGPYKLREVLGDGGMGIVFAAEQEHPIRRKVAVKVIKPGMDTREVIARFEAERQALALMDHPNIAKVHDAGTSEAGRPYFAMELVRGLPITTYCDQAKLPLRDRLQLFVTVCHAVQHAHQKGIIHRDLKPSNVMVTLHDGVPVPKIIDFGIAKALNQRLTDKTIYTCVAQFLGTPMYMSPEQAELSGLDVDTRSDLYSLGVLLYELLTSRTPFSKEEFSKLPYDQICRVIREDEPPSPSARISTLGDADRTTIASERGIIQRHLVHTLRGELDWIVMRALEKDRTRRYESASALARDIERHLRDEPVQACPPSKSYRFRKLARRHKGALISVTAVALAALLAVAALAISTLRIGKAKGELAQALERERQNLARERLEAYFQRIAGAQRALATEDLGLALKLLDECPPDLRGWEWRYLMRLCRVEPLVISDDTELNGLAFSPDGERIASAGGDGSVKIWNSRTGNVAQTLENAHSDSVVCVAFHPDGQHLASVGADRHVKVWNLTTGQRLFDEPCDVVRKLGTAYTVAFSPPDGRLLAAGSYGSVMVWDWKNRHQFPEQTFPVHAGQTVPVVFSRDGRRLATGTRAEGLLIWDVERGGRPLRTFPAHQHPVSALAFGPDGGRLASASFDRTVKVWDTTTGEQLLHPLLHTGTVDCVAFSPDGKRLASGGEDKTVHIWDAATGREVLGLRRHTGRCACVAFSTDGLRLASASTDGTIRVWDATPLRGDEQQEILNFTRHNDRVLSVAYCPDGQRIVSAGYDAVVKVWDAQTEQVRAEFTGHELVVFGVACHPDGQRIASAGSDGLQHAVKVWDSRTGQEADFKIRAERSPGVYFAVAFSPDGRYLVTGHVTGAVEVWDAKTGEGVGTLGTHGREVRGVVFSRDGRRLASSSEGQVKIWDATRLEKQQQALHTLPARVPGPSVNVAFSPDGRRLATGGEKNTIVIWDVESGVELLTLWGEHSGEIYAVAFNPNDDGPLIATAGEDSSVKVWNSHTGKLIHSFRGHTGLVSCLAFSPDGRRLVSGSRDTTVKVWDMTQLSNSERKP